MSSLPLQLNSAARFVKPKFSTALPAAASGAASHSSAGICRSSTGDGRNHQHAVSLLKLVVVAAQEADVFLVDVNVYEAPHLPRVVAQMLVDCGESLLDF